MMGSTENLFVDEKSASLKNLAPFVEKSLDLKKLGCAQESTFDTQFQLLCSGRAEACELEGVSCKYFESRSCDFNAPYTEFDLKTNDIQMNLNNSNKDKNESASSQEEDDQEYKYFDIQTPPEADVPSLKETNYIEASHLESRSRQERSVKKILMDLIQNMFSDQNETTASFTKRIKVDGCTEEACDNQTTENSDSNNQDFIFRPVENFDLNLNIGSHEYTESVNKKSFVSLNNKNIFEAKNNLKASKADLEYYGYQKDDFVEFDSLNKSSSLDPAKESKLDDDQEIFNYGKYCPYFSHMQTDDCAEMEPADNLKDALKKLSNKQWDIRTNNEQNALETDFEKVDQKFYDKVYENSDTNKFNVIENSIYEHYKKEKTFTKAMKELTQQKEKAISEIESRYQSQVNRIQKQHQEDIKKNSEIKNFLKKITDWVSELEQLNEKMTALRLIMKNQGDFQLEINKFEYPEIKRLVQSRNSENKKMMEIFLADSDLVIKNILKYRSFTGFDIVVCQSLSLKIEKLIVENNNLGSTK